MHPAGPPRRFLVLIVLVFGFISLLYITSFKSHPERAALPSVKEHSTGEPASIHVSADTLAGHVIAPKLGNATVKAELGRAAWKFLHTTFARFPDKPTKDEQEALRSFIYLFHRLYPCGDCAEHFTPVLKKYPPQVSSRSAAAAWGCHVHNVVNKALHKEQFDCSKIGDFYDCGCGDDKKKTESVSTPAKPDMDPARVEKLTGTNGRDVDEDYLTIDRPLKIETEGYQRGG